MHDRFGRPVHIHLFRSCAPGLRRHLGVRGHGHRRKRRPGRADGDRDEDLGAPASTPGHVSGSGEIRVAGDKISFDVDAKSDREGRQGHCKVEDRDTKRKIKCTDVTVLVVSGNEADIYGNATDNGVATTYVIHVVDNGDPGKGNDTFSITTASGYSASGTLTAGNIKIH